MAYKYTTGSLRRGDIYNEDDEDWNTYIDWDADGVKERITIWASGSMVFDAIGHAGPNLISDASSSFFSSATGGGWGAEGVGGAGTVIKFDDVRTSTTAGLVYYLKADGTWGTAAANNGATGATGSLLAMATGPDSSVGLQLHGLVRVDAARISGSIEKGAPIYLATSTTGEIQFSLPSGSGEVVRVLGYCVDKDGSNNILMYFNPSRDYVLLTS